MGYVRAGKKEGGKEETVGGYNEKFIFVIDVV
jgi:hypothetical protein